MKKTYRPIAALHGSNAFASDQAKGLNFVAGQSETVDLAIAACYARPGDVTALEELDRALRPYLLALLISLFPSEAALAEDAYQTSFLKFIQAFKSGRRPERELAYLIAIARNTFVDLIRKERRLRAYEDFLESAIPEGPSDFERVESQIDLLQAIARLDRRCQFVLERHYLQGVELVQLERQLQVSPNTMYTVLSRCRSRLLRMMKERQNEPNS